MGNQCCTADEKPKQNAFQSAKGYDNNSNNNQYGADASTILTSSTNTPAPLSSASASNNNNNNLNNLSGGGGASNGNGNVDMDSKEAERAEQAAMAEREERQRALQQEQNRLEEIVSLAGRDMVPLWIRGGSMGSLSSTGNNNAAGGNIGGGAGGGGGVLGCYDPVYANIVRQDLVGGMVALTEAITEEDMERIMAKSCVVPKTCIKDGRDAVDVLCRGVDIDFSDYGVSKDNDHDIGGRSGGDAGRGGGKMSHVLLEDMAETFLASVLHTKEGLFQGVGPIVENLP